MTIDLHLDCHMHSAFSDGSTSIDQLAASALEKGLRTIAVTDHMPLPFKTRYAMAFDRIHAYREEIETARQHYGQDLTILTGLEIEYIPRHKEWIQQIVEMGWDLLLVSVHCVDTRQGYYIVNGREDEFKDLLNQGFKGDIQALCTHYYELIQEAATTGWFDIAAHMDVIKKHNKDNCYFDESSPWYRSLVLKTLAALADSGMKMEVNTNGINHPAATPYPDLWIIRAAREKGIPLILGSDAHSPGWQGQYFDRVYTMITATA